MNRKRLSLILLLQLVLLLPQLTRADVLVLVHGYLGGAESWDKSGVTTVLEQNGWRHAGTYASGPGDIYLFPGRSGTVENKGNRFYTVNLPSEAPVMVQAFELQKMLATINEKSNDERMIIAAHSAGGIVSRAALVHGDFPNVVKLITIATPHVGTVRAEQVLDATDIPFPLSLMTDFVGGQTYHTVRRSRHLLIDLTRPRPGSLLYHLNTEPHPDIEYVSVIRSDGEFLTGDRIVPGFSQDMNNVPALRGKSSVIPVSGHHELGFMDGSTLVGLLEG